MRQPSDRTAAWAQWRARLDGAVVQLGTAPVCGLYKAKRFGRWVAVQIDLAQEIDPDTGELLADEELSAWRNGEPVDPCDVWTYCAANPIGADEFQRLQRAPVVVDLSKEFVI